MPLPDGEERIISLLEFILDRIESWDDVRENLKLFLNRATEPEPPQVDPDDPDGKEAPLPVVTHWLKMKDGTYTVAKVPDGAAPGFCKECNGRFYWVVTKRGQKVPLNRNGTKHWDTCSQRENYPRQRQARDRDPERNADFRERARSSTPSQPDLPNEVPF